MRLGCVQYDEKLNRDAIRFKELAEQALKDIGTDGGAPVKPVTKKVVTKKIIKKTEAQEG